jgi:uncharacterized protein (DUF433 family)
MQTTLEVVPHVHRDERGRAWIDETNFKVIEIVLDHLGYGWNAEAIQENHPHLTLAQVYAALAWYYDHQAEMDAEIEQQDERLRALKAVTSPSPLQRRSGGTRRSRAARSR